MIGHEITWAGAFQESQVGFSSLLLFSSLHIERRLTVIMLVDEMGTTCARLNFFLPSIPLHYIELDRGRQVDRSYISYDLCPLKYGTEDTFSNSGGHLEM